MSSDFYLPRHLRDYENTYTEAELLAASNYVVVLAEPGGGKSFLMRSLAKKLGSEAVTANVFAHSPITNGNKPLVIDAFDELAKIDSSGIYKLLGKAKETSPTHVYLSSRSSEWDHSSTNAFKEFFGQTPLLVWLCEFDETEQQAIFEVHVEKEDFCHFQSEVSRFDLGVLLPNPQFLKLFADAYVESGRRFTDKRSIFSQAVERLAKEANPDVRRTHSTLSLTQKIDIASDVFIKLLLSGSEGVCTNEAIENRMFPLLLSLVKADIAPESILATRLFKPVDSEGLHNPVHKIVAEYCAADYLIKRIIEPTDNLTLPKCLAIIAPNSTVRDELRGLIGWMAALGNKSIEEGLIKLDPYAVLANGDPSQLELSSKQLLVRGLKYVSDNNPWFRRGDFWRRFSVSGFFTEDFVDEIKVLLSGSEGHLRDLVLELLSGAQIVKKVSVELCQLVLASDESIYSRRLANRLLLEIEGYDYLSLLSDLISTPQAKSLQIGADIIEKIGPEKFELAYLSNYFRICMGLYPNEAVDIYDRAADDRYFIKYLISHLDLEIVESLLDELTEELSCICGKESYECWCRNGVSKVVGSMLDRYFELAKPPFDPVQVWEWVKALNYHCDYSENHNKSVEVLQRDVHLRQDILTHVFGSLTDREKIWEYKNVTFQSYSQTHSGLRFRSGDYKFLIDYAFRTDNVLLWACFIEFHKFYAKVDDKGPNRLRRHMREQANEKPLFMMAWAKNNRDAVTDFKKRNVNRRHRRLIRGMKTRRVEQFELRERNKKYIQEQRELVESGRHFKCLTRFARITLESPDKIEQEVGDEELVKTALRNCFDFIKPNIPKLYEVSGALSRIQRDSLVILYAACLEVIRFEGGLQGVDLMLLKALRADVDRGYNGVSNEERIFLKTEVDSYIFSDSTSAENYLREYFEPQLSKTGCNPDLWILRCDGAFKHLRPSLPIEWLSCYEKLPLRPLDTLFEISAQYGDRAILKEIISERCEKIKIQSENFTDNDENKDEQLFWYVRAFFFIDDTPEVYWDWIKSNKDNVLELYHRFDSRNDGERWHWPTLTSKKIEAILDAFIGKWPKVKLSNVYGASSSPEEKAYRFLTEIIWSIGSDNPDNAIPVLNRLISDSRYSDLHNALKSILAEQMRKKALRDFEPPTPRELVDILDSDKVVTVEGLRELIIEELQVFQNDIDGGEFNPAERFYDSGVHLNENSCTEIIAERLHLRLEPKGITITSEHQLKCAKRSDFTVAKVFRDRRRLLVAEVKGQWHDELYTAASEQLNKRYSIHPDAEHQGIYLVLWFGKDVKVANRKIHGIESADQLKTSIEKRMPQELRGFIDIFVLDVCKSK